MAGGLACWSAFVVGIRPAGARPGAGDAIRPGRRSAAARCWSALLIVAAFLVNRNIFNSDNYRYLIFLLTPWSLGFGLLLHDLARRGWLGLAGRRGSSPALLVEVMTATTFLWYRDERHYIDEQGMPVRLPRSGLVGADGR